MAQKTHAQKFNQNIGNGKLALVNLSDAINHAIETQNTNQVAACYDAAIKKKDSQSASRVRLIASGIWIDCRFKKNKNGTHSLPTSGLSLSNSGVTELARLVSNGEVLRGKPVMETFGKPSETKTATQQMKSLAKSVVSFIRNTKGISLDMYIKELTKEFEAAESKAS